MTGRLLRFEELTGRDLGAIDRKRSVLFGAVGPPEIHGPHLPLGTDLRVAEALRDSYARRFLHRHRDRDAILLPTLPLGADALPRPGSLQVPSRALEAVLYSWGVGLSRAGFGIMVLADNHGGPRHLLAVEAAAERLWRRHGFILVTPFCEVFSRMVSEDPEILAVTGLAADAIGGLSDLHAGTNETSLFMVLGEREILPPPAMVPPVEPPEVPRWARIISRILEGLGAGRLSDEVWHLGIVSAWASREDVAHLGAPDRATREAGERMFSYRVDLCEKLLDVALTGERPRTPPPLWSLRILRFLP